MSAGGGLSASNSSSSNTGAQKGGDLKTGALTFGGINTGSQNSTLMIVAIAAAIAVGLVLVFRKR